MKSIIILFLVSFSSFVSAQIATKQWELNLNASGNHNLLYESNSIYVTGEGGIGFSMEGNGGEHLFWVSNSGVLLFKKTFSEGQVYVNHVTSNAMSYTLRLRPAEGGENYEKYLVTLDVGGNASEQLTESGDGQLFAEFMDGSNTLTKGYHTLVRNPVTTELNLSYYSLNPPTTNLAISSFGIDASSNLVVSWESIVGKSYQVQSSTSLTGSSWSNIGVPITGNGTVMNYSTPATQSAQFFRVITW